MATALIMRDAHLTARALFAQLRFACVIKIRGKQSSHHHLCIFSLSTQTSCNCLYSSINNFLLLHILTVD